MAFGASSGEPLIASIVPGAGPASSASEVTLRGANLADAQISANGTVISPSFQSATEVRVRVPAGANGYVTLAARTLYGTAYAEFVRRPPTLDEIRPGEITTIAGAGLFFGDGRPATQAMVEPSDLALGTRGDIFVGEPGQARIRRIRADGVIEAYAGNGLEGFSGDGGPASEARLWQPRGIALDGNGNLYIADTWRSRIRRVDALTGVITTVAGTGTAGFSGDGGPASRADLNLPVQLAFDRAGNLYVLECGNSRVRRIDPAGIISTVAGTGTPGFSGDGGPATAAQINIGDGVFVDVGGLDVDPAGNIYIADTTNNRIRRIASATGIITTVAEAAQARAVATDASGNVYFATNDLGSPQLARIIKLDPQGRTIATFGRDRGVAPDGTPAAEARLGFIDRVRVDATGNILFTDFTVLRVRRINIVTGLLETVAGIGPRTIGESGPATDAVLGTFNGDIAFDSRGSLVVADGGLNRIRRIDSANRITTIAGSGLFGVIDTDDVPAIDAQIFGAVGIDIPRDGTTLIVDLHAVRRIGADGIIRLAAGNASRDPGLSGDGGPAIGARFLQPFDVASDAAGNLYIADTNNNRVRRVDAASGIVTTVAGSGAPNGFERYGTGATCGDGGPATAACINTPYGVAVDRDGNLFISENWQRIRKVDRSGVITTLASVYATKMVLDAAGNLYAVANSRIVRVSPQGTVTTVAGTGSNGFSGDGGSALAAEIDASGQASGIAISAKGDLYFSDGGNRRIRVVKGAAIVDRMMSVDRASLTFAATSTGASLSSQTASQTVRLTQSSGAPVTWTATASVPWLTVTPASGTGPAALSISVKFDARLPASGTVTGAITLAMTGAPSTVDPLNVTLTILPTTAAASVPFGSFDTPAGDASVLAGSIALTGWALDNVGVKQLELWRDIQPGETTPAGNTTPGDPRNGKVFIANATFVDNARPDVEDLNPTTPLAYRAGWGYLMLTWGLFGQGNGTYKLYAFAVDQEGNTATIGTKTVVISNNTATKPFGSIDTPAIGGDASGPNFGWGLTPKVNGVATCKIQPSGVQYSIDSGPLQPVVYGDARADIAGAFTGFSNTAAAGGHAIIDWTALTNGSHTIGWLITDDCNRADGIGSRFFSVTNGTALRAADTDAAVVAPASLFAANRPDETESDLAITVARGYGELPEIVEPGIAGSRVVDMKQGDRIELRLPRGFDSAYQRGPRGLRRALPIGSTFDVGSEKFYWQPSPGFLGAFPLVFSNGSERITVRVVITP
jgi:sugar lactone lactonase YvrE